MADNDDEADATPRMSGTLQRAPIFEAQARDLAARFSAMAEGLENEALRMAKGDLAQLDIAASRRKAAGAAEARRKAAEARVLERFFSGWAKEDPGSDARTEAAMRLRNLASLGQSMLPPPEPSS